MNNIRNILVTLITVSACLATQAQGTPRSFKYELSQPDSLYGSRVAVSEERGIEPALNREAAPDEKVKGFRVRIFLDNKQWARTEASAAEKKFKELFPGVACYSEYSEPYFRVTVGDCLTKDEAQMLQAKIIGIFPGAFIIPEDIPLANFIIHPGEVVIPATTETAQEDTP